MQQTGLYTLLEDINQTAYGTLDDVLCEAKVYIQPVELEEMGMFRLMKIKNSAFYVLEQPDEVYEEEETGE